MPTQLEGRQASRGRPSPGYCAGGSCPCPGQGPAWALDRVRRKREVPVEGEWRERRERGWGGSGTSSLELTRGGLTWDLAHTVLGLGLEEGVTELRVRVRVDGQEQERLTLPRGKGRPVCPALPKSPAAGRRLRVPRGPPIRPAPVPSPSAESQPTRFGAWALSAGAVGTAEGTKPVLPRPAAPRPACGRQADTGLRPSRPGARACPQSRVGTSPRPSSPSLSCIRRRGTWWGRV